jgi:RNA polymerase sigma-70 factor (ECF subfamily)
MAAREKNIKIKLDKQAFEALFRSFFPSLVLFAQKYVPDQDTAKEIVHNVFINLWEKRQQVDTGSSLKSYIFTSVHNRCLNYIRDQKKFDRDETRFHRLDSTEFSDGVDRLEEQELEQRIYDALQTLPEKCREIFMLNRFDGLKYAEIAEKLNISVKTVETQMSRALRILREKLVDYLGVIILFILTHLN